VHDADGLDHVAVVEARLVRVGHHHLGADLAAPGGKKRNT
jgi:hypothetical protein